MDTEKTELEKAQEQIAYLTEDLKKAEKERAHRGFAILHPSGWLDLSSVSDWEWHTIAQYAATDAAWEKLQAQGYSLQSVTVTININAQTAEEYLAENEEGS